MRSGELSRPVIAVFADSTTANNGHGIFTI